MKIVFLAGSNVVHTVRWVNSLAKRGHEVHLVSLQHGGDKLDDRIRRVKFPFPPVSGYYLNAPFLYAYLRNVKPNIIHAHYATGYGTLGRLSGFRPFILSVLGSDVYDFPKYSSRNRNLVIKNLMSADRVCSTSHAMAKVTQDLCPYLDSISITPFGVDTELFAPDIQQRDTNYVTVGTVKRLEKKYGIDVLIRSFASMVKNIQKDTPQLYKMLRLIIVGEGSEHDSLVMLANELGVGEVTRFTGSVANSDVPSYLNQMDVYAALSRLDSESFGVAILEASSCGVPVVVSDVDGPKETVVNNKTGIIVPREDVQASATALQKLVKSNALRSCLGIAGRYNVIHNYDWERSIDTMETVYNNIISTDDEWRI